MTTPEAGDTNGTKRPTSPTKIESNRRNAMRSTGPRTQQRKSVSRFNGMTHGACSKLGVLPGEDPEVKRARLVNWLEQLDARTEPERFLVETAVDASCCLERARRAETAALSIQILHVEEDF